jgi:glycosyl transferase family 87
MTPRSIGRAVAPYLAPLAVVALEWGLLSPVPALVDHFQFWAAGQMVVTGASPYDRSAWEAMAALGPVPDGIAVNTVIANLQHTNAVWLYPPQTAFLFAPFGALPLAPGIAALHLFVLATALAALAIAARALGLRGARLAFALTLAVLSQPFIITVRNGHPLGLVVIGLVLIFVGCRDRRMVALAAGVALVSLKPQLVAVFGLGVLGYLVVRRDWRSVGAMAVGLAAVTLPAELASPFPFAQVLAATNERLALDLSTVGALSRDLGGGPALVIALTILGLAACIVAARGAPAAGRATILFAALLTANAVTSPYLHDYDMFTLLPAAFAVMTIAAAPAIELGLLVLGGLLVAAAPWVLFLWFALRDEGGRVYQGGPLGALPLLVAFALAGAVMVVRSAGRPRARVRP